ncbi:MAG TPA: plastocyanin/azurin family copper-binding protein [Longimicrobiaceae bacterium]|nr:plastocyanin/azurin family copper-binding protein [Longimicrobiaceae bacterium]
MRRFTIATAGLLFLVGACSDSDSGTDPNPPDETGTISGQVAAGSEGVEGASITLSGGGSETTSSSGQYSFTNLDAGSYTVTLAVPAGFALGAGESTAKPATVTGGETTTINWTLETTGEVPQNANVTLTASTFDPPTVTIGVGGTVQWTNGTATTHTITPDNSGQAGAWTSQNISGDGTTFSHQFNVAGTYDYHCQIHSGMTGEITVQ